MSETYAEAVKRSSLEMMQDEEIGDSLNYIDYLGGFETEGDQTYARPVRLGLQAKRLERNKPASDEDGIVRKLIKKQDSRLLKN